MSTLICPTCQQVLPKTAVMCPNCGNRSLTPNTNPTNVPPISTFTPRYDSAPVSAPAHAYASYPSHTTYSTNNPPTNNTSYPNTAAYQMPFAPTAEPLTEPVNTATYSPQQPAYEQTASYPATPYAPAESLPTPANRLASHMVYAGFLRRAMALVFDWVIVSVLIALAYQFALPPLLTQLNIRALNEQALVAAGFGIYWLYHAILTCFSRQATIGKIIMGLWVFNMQGQRIGLLRALWRELIKPLLLPFAFIAWFTARKQTLHDLLAGTVVLFDR